MISQICRVIQNEQEAVEIPAVHEFGGTPELLA